MEKEDSGATMSEKLPPDCSSCNLISLGLVTVICRLCSSMSKANYIVKMSSIIMLNIMLHGTNASNGQIVQ